MRITCALITIPNLILGRTKAKKLVFYATTACKEKKRLEG